MGGSLLHGGSCELVHKNGRLFAMRASEFLSQKDASHSSPMLGSDLAGQAHGA